jgi:hypothetical protein
MTFNQSVGLGVGLVPLIGDLMLAVWKANSRKCVVFFFPLFTLSP